MLKVAFLIFDQVDALDITGPFEVFTMTNEASGASPPFELFTVSQDGGTVKTLGGLGISSDYRTDNAPDLENGILFVPGGAPVTMADFPVKYAKTIQWVRNLQPDLEILASVLSSWRRQKSKTGLR